MKKTLLLTLLTPALIFLCLEAYLILPNFFYILLIIASVLIFFTVKYFIKKSIPMSEIEGLKKKWWNFFLTPVILLISISFYLTLVFNRAFIQILIIGLTVLLYIYFKEIYHFLVKPSRYKEKSLETLFLYLSFISVFFFASAIYGLQSFLNFPVRILMMVMLLITVFTVRQIIWVHKIKGRLGTLFIIIASFLLFQVSWVLSFLPLNYNVTGLSLGIFFYVVINLIKSYLEKTLDKARIKTYLIMGLVTILLILLTAKWM